LGSFSKEVDSSGNKKIGVKKSLILLVVLDRKLEKKTSILKSLMDKQGPSQKS
jgi:hypothetical protein